ncbi:ubiquitin-like-specific protease 1D isoform X2 [Diospyros lotus]|uniref:ubiquitin-like-specific protease 1D isoform X2 n=1 Tax=Diospyros lotus TaxID=55363 RepID=UPI0022537748|nr:ubiquitin-like-specific protease 1D isoform X2 [Diospyros lotus]
MEGDEEQKKKKGPIDLNWDVLLPNRDEEPPQLIVIATDKEQSPPPPMDGGEQDQWKREELARKTDADLEESINRQRRHVETLRLPDGGAKLRAQLKRFEEERESRRLRRLQKDDDGCEELTKSKNSCFANGHSQEASSSLPASQSAFTTHFYKKLEENQRDGRAVNAFERELSFFGRCGRRKTKLNGQLSPREQQRSALSSRRRTSEAQLLNNLRPKNGETVVLVDEEEHELIDSMEPAENVDECMKESKIFYPSSDDPESIEICYSDMECLAPESYLSSTIMNFYIRYLQQETSSTEREKCDYHFFNTYFYNKLKEAVLKKNDKENFAKFRRWWKGVNIFHKAYILLPIHESLHWSLVIICIPDKEDESGPIILHLDSLGLHFSNLIFGNIRSFLKEEWKHLNEEEAPPSLPISDRIWKHLPRRLEERTIEVPQQKNEYDCGLFVLFFMERFIDEAPQRLKKKNLGMFGKKWFRPEEASNLRVKIKKLLMEEFRKARKDNCILNPEPLSSVNPRGERIVQPIIDC